MGKILITIALVLSVALTSMADTRSQQLLGALSAKIDGYAGYAVKFKVNVQGQAAVYGDYLVHGNSFYIKVDSREIYSNGRVKYEVNGDDREVVIDNIDPKDKDILTNPTKAFEFLGGNFTHSYSGRSVNNGKSVETVVLKPTAKGTPYSDITLMLDSASGLPVAVKYRMAELSSQVDIAVLSFVVRSDIKESAFTFDKGKYKGFELIDFR